jgi:hypothetical protein
MRVRWRFVLIYAPASNPFFGERWGHSSFPACAVRFEAFANNVTDEAHPTQATIDTGTPAFVFNPPRTCGVRLRVEF